MCELCRDLGVNRIQVDRWEEQALEGMLQALERKARKSSEPELKTLGSHLERLLERRLPKRLEKMAKLQERLGQIQAKSKDKESKQD